MTSITEANHSVNPLVEYAYQLNGSYSQLLPDHDNNGSKTVTTYTADGRGRIGSITDPLTFVTEYAYSELDQLTRTTLPDPDGLTPATDQPVYQTSYDGLGRVKTQTDAKNQITHYWYSRNTSTHESTVEIWLPSPDGTAQARPVTKATYDANGNLKLLEEGSVPYNASTTDPNSVTRDWMRQTRYVYDAVDRLIEVHRTQPQTGVATPSATLEYLAERFTYDKNGNVLTAEQAITTTLMQLTSYVYDARNRPVNMTEQDPDPTVSGDQPVWVYGYDIGNRLTSVTDPAANVTDFGYDRLDRLTTITAPDLGGGLGRPVYTTVYDTLGRVTREIDPLNNYQQIVYDALGNVAEVYDKDHMGVTVTATFMTYDDNGRLTSSTTDNARTNHGYDRLGRLTGLTLPDPDDAMPFGGTYTNTSGSLPRPFRSYTYDVSSNLATETHQTHKGNDTATYATTTFGYDFLNRLTSRTDATIAPGTPVTSYTYNVFGDMLTLTDADGNTTNHSRIRQIKDEFANTTWNDTRIFTYDDKDQLTAADHTNTAQTDEAYAYAKNGSRSGTQTQLGGGDKSYVLGTNNRITSDGVYNYLYNAEGNLTRKTHAINLDYEEYTYDHRNRLLKIFFRNSSGVIQRTIAYRYDHQNQLLRRMDVPYVGGVPGTGTTDSFVHDHGQIVLAFSKTGSSEAQLTNRYLWAEAVDHLLSDEHVTSLTSAGTVYWSLEDQIGTVRDLATYSSGTTTVAKHRDYDSFGNLIRDTAPTIDQYFGYAARYTEEATGDTHNTFRWYKPRIGQFLQEDPIQSASGQDNWRIYVGNSPINFTDPSGLKPPVDRSKWGPLSGRIAEFGYDRNGKAHPAGMIAGPAAVLVGIFDAAIPSYIMLGADCNAKMLDEASSPDPERSIPAGITVVVMLQAESTVAAPSVVIGVWKHVNGSATAVSRVATNADNAFFWSGRTNGVGGAKRAMEIAGKNGGTTLENLIEQRGVKMPDWDPNNPASIEAWNAISAEYAANASGHVRAVVGKNLRSGNTWECIELPTLKKNRNVTKITTIDPETGQETVIFTR